jgi:soluble lytic murein transglycosylase-like protein
MRLAYILTSIIFLSWATLPSSPALALGSKETDMESAKTVLDYFGLLDKAVDAKRFVKGLLTPDIESVAQYSGDPLVRSVILQESGGDPNAVSPKGAEGLMQIMPNTAKKPGFGVKPLKDAFDPQENVRFGTDYLYALKNRYGNTRDALIAYNWGVGNTDKWLKSGAAVDKLPKETRNYFSSVMGRLDSGR